MRKSKFKRVSKTKKIFKKKPTDQNRWELGRLTWWTMLIVTLGVIQYLSRR